MSRVTVINKMHLPSYALLGTLLALALVLSVALAGSVSAAEESDDGSYSVSGTSNPQIILTLGTSSVDLTGVDPTCASVGGTSAYAGSTGNEGCAYLWTISVQVQSNRAWIGTLTGEDNGQTTSDLRVENDSYYASTSSIGSYSDCIGATTVPESGQESAWMWEASGAQGNISGTHSHCVLVDWDDDDGTISATMSYSVSQ